MTFGRKHRKQRIDPWAGAAAMTAELRRRVEFYTPRILAAGQRGDIAEINRLSEAWRLEGPL